MTDHHYMQMAIDLAAMASGQTAPNPVVGAVLVKAGQVVGLGAHLRAGTPHAEVHALRMAGSEARGATLYVTLEPCSHTGRTPPCATALIEAGVSRAFVAMVDPFPAVAGQGIARLEQAGIDVYVGMMEAKARELNKGYLHFLRYGRPFVTWKSALSLDGRIALREGAQTHLTGLEARRLVHQLRNRVDAIAVGVGTILADDPALTTRFEDGAGHHPRPLIFDSRLRTPPSAKVMRASGHSPLIYCAESASVQREQALSACGATVVRAPGIEQVDLRFALRHAGQSGIQHLLLEGGQRLASSFLAVRAVDEAWIFHTPRLFGTGVSALSTTVPLSGDGIQLEEISMRQVGQDRLITGRLVYESARDDPAGSVSQEPSARGTTGCLQD